MKNWRDFVWNFNPGFPNAEVCNCRCANWLAFHFYSIKLYCSHKYFILTVSDLIVFSIPHVNHIFQLILLSQFVFNEKCSFLFHTILKVRSGLYSTKLCINTIKFIRNLLTFQKILQIIVFLSYSYKLKIGRYSFTTSKLAGE